MIRVFFFFFGLVHNYPERCLSEILSWLIDDKGGGRLVYEKYVLKFHALNQDVVVLLLLEVEYKSRSFAISM